MSVGEVVERYLAYRRAAGSEYVCGAQHLRRVASLLGKSADAGALAGANIEELILADGHMTLTSRMKLSSLSVFLRWCVARGFLAGMPRLPEPPRNLHPARPHIFSDDEIRRLLSANHMRRHSRSRIPVETARMALLLTCAMGLRIGETLSLTVGDIDTDRNVATIRETKFYKTRIVPFNSAVAQKLGDFVIWRKNSGLPVAGESLLFTNRNGAPLTYSRFLQTFRWLCEDAGIARGAGDSRDPRIHDLRHTFAVRRMLAWYREGRDVQSLLPKLSVYMGHSSVAGTSPYLSMTPELLGASCERFERFAKGGPRHG